MSLNRPRLKPFQPAGRKRAAPGRPSNKELADRIDTRDALLNATAELMSERDTVDIPLSAIADRAGQSAALVQYHFEGKEGLFLALLERVFHKGVSELRYLAAMDIPADKKLRMHINALVQIYYEAPYINRLLNVVLRDASEETARRVYHDYSHPIIDFHRSVLAEGEREGLFVPVDVMGFHFMLVGACEHIFARRSLLAFGFGVQEITPEIRRTMSMLLTQTILNGLAPRQA